MIEQYPRHEITPPDRESLLTKEFVDAILQLAKENLQRDDAFAPVLFMRLNEGDPLIAPLALPPTHAEQVAYFAGIRFSIEYAGKRLREAVFVFKSWYVNVEPGHGASLNVAPSQYPRCREAITIVGRNAERTRFTTVVQTFTRDRNHRPVFGATDVAEYNTPLTSRSQPTGLLDQLFAKRMHPFSMN